ncbi:hypothetical protein LSCM1_00409 [Leishmania martiniquensis]|uniref:Aminomethyltransferase n=1 Tax=Leishmania martiniquensis TaxID=1580590 RepID=A0A836G2R2_9TRYP|nr:hypothetical protein LSCM1_00409 [Leishmania martiniquensis]
MSSSLRKTALHSFHLARQARMEAFAGYHMPISYRRLGVLKEHLYTREVAGVFDVSHMGQYEVRGADRERFVEHVTPIDLHRTPAGQAALTMLTNAQGGIKDDCIVTKMEDHLFLVLNAACKEKDIAHMEAALHEGAMKGADVQLVPLERSLVALQGPKAAAILSEFMDGVPDMNFMCCRQRVNIKGMEMRVTRCGYTGEDGFEISVSNEDVVALVELFVSKKAEMIGLGARDSLRLEAGLNLYGHELTEETNPVAARFMWSISKRRMEEGGFLGYERIKYFRDNASKGAVPRLRVGLVSTGPVARENTAIEVNGKRVGAVTSGGPSPCLKKNIALGYLDRELAKKGVKVDLVVRDRRVPAEVVTPPFVTPHFYRKPE